MASTNYGLMRREYVQPFLPKAETALDVGCGNGGFCSVLKEHGVRQVWGIEPDGRAAADAQAWADRVIAGSFPDDLPEEHPPFDLVTFTDVLEHFVDPWAVLRSTRSILSPNGRVVASIPNLRYWTVLVQLLVRRDFTYQAMGILDRTHLRFFTRKTMVGLFEASGYVVEACEPGTKPPSRKGFIAGLFLGQDVRVKQFVIVARPLDGPVQISRG